MTAGRTQKFCQPEKTRNFQPAGWTLCTSSFLCIVCTCVSYCVHTVATTKHLCQGRNLQKFKKPAASTTSVKVGWECNTNNFLTNHANQMMSRFDFEQVKKVGKSNKLLRNKRTNKVGNMFSACMLPHHFGHLEGWQGREAEESQEGNYAEEGLVFLNIKPVQIIFLQLPGLHQVWCWPFTLSGRQLRWPLVHQRSEIGSQALPQGWPCRCLTLSDVVHGLLSV